MVSASAFLLLAFAAGAAPQGWERSAVRSAADLPGAIEAPLWVVMQAGTRVAIVIAAGALVVARQVRAGMAVLVAGGLAWLAAVIAKDVIARPRPSSASIGRSLRDQVEGNGFPSSHAAIAAALAVALVFALRPPIWVSAVLGAVAVGVGFARIFFGVHWPSDVAGGMALGALAGATGAVLLRP